MIEQAKSSTAAHLAGSAGSPPESPDSGFSSGISRFWISSGISRFQGQQPCRRPRSGCRRWQRRTVGPEVWQGHDGGLGQMSVKRGTLAGEVDAMTTNGRVELSSYSAYSAYSAIGRDALTGSWPHASVLSA